MRIQPFGNNVVVAVSRDGESKSAGGIITVNVGEPYFTAEVLAIGEGIFLQDNSLVEPNAQVGDVVVLPKNAEMILVSIENGRNIYVVDDRSLLGKIDA